MNKFQLTYKPFGESAILIEWPQQISKDILNDIRLFVSKIENLNSEQILELNFIYSSLLIIYKSDKINFSDFKKELQFLYNEGLSVATNFDKTIWEIPVCYDLEFGMDLLLLSSKKNLSIAAIISMHSSVSYTVYGIGFLPGFLYLGGLSEKLHFPRRNTPRLKVPKGSVGIAGNQTGIYPQTSPGGWHLIGRTPVSLFDVKRETPCVIMPGDEIRFKAISKKEFEIIELEQDEGNYKLKKGECND